MKSTVLLYPHTTSKDGRLPVKLRISGVAIRPDGKRVPVTRYVLTHVKVKAAEWDAATCRVKKANPHHLAFNKKITEMERRAEDLIVSGMYSHPDQVLGAMFDKPRIVGDFYAMARASIDRPRIKPLSPRTAKTRHSILRQVEKLRPGLRVGDFNRAVLEDLGVRMRESGLAVNTVNNRLRKLRTMWLDVCRAEGIQAASPWKEIVLEDEASLHVNLTLAEVLRFATVDLSRQKPFLAIARDAVMLSYYLGGRRFTDLVLHEPGQIIDGHLQFTVNKSKRRVIKRLYLTEGALLIIGRYRSGPYLLPLISKRIADKQELLDAVDRANGKVNLALKVVAALAGIQKNMTTRTIRHTVANYIKGENISTALASELLDHDDQSTTETYMDSFPTEAIRKVLVDLSGAVAQPAAAMAQH